MTYMNNDADMMDDQADANMGMQGGSDDADTGMEEAPAAEPMTEAAPMEEAPAEMPAEEPAEEAPMEGGDEGMDDAAEESGDEGGSEEGGESEM